MVYIYAGDILSDNITCLNKDRCDYKKPILTHLITITGSDDMIDAYRDETRSTINKTH
jgi:hypothetical protein